MEETQDLYRGIFSGANNNRSTLISQEQIGFDRAIGQLREASQAIDLAKEQLQQALQLIAKISEHSD